MSPYELFRIESALGDVFDELGTAQWLEEPQKLLGGRKPIDCPFEEVWRVVDQITSGVFI